MAEAIDGVQRIPVKTLTKMMVAGQNQVVMKYLRTLPSDECAEVREQLIKNLELIQQQQKKKPESKSNPESLAPTSTPTTTKTSDSSSSSRSKDKQGGTTSRRNKSSASKSDSSSNSKLQITEDDTHDKNDKGIDRSEKPQVGNYSYVKDLGRGQFGVVFKAKHNTSGIKVAIKEINTDQISAATLPGIMKEAEVMAGLDHPNILKIFEVVKTKKRIYFILDYINRGSLLGLIKSCGNFPDDVASYFVKQTCEGLKYLHETHSIIHRDIKCANLLLTVEGVIKLADFGTAKEDAGKSFTVIGTPFWMAPEIIEVAGAHAVSDIWSLGCTIVEMLRGTPPYFELATMQALFKIVEDPHPPIPSTFSDEVKNVLKNYCFVKDVKKRATASQMLKLPWLNKFDRLIDYTTLCAMIKKDEPTPSKGKKTDSLKTPKSSSKSSRSEETTSSHSSSLPLTAASIATLQQEIEKLSLEQVKLQKELDALTGNV